MRKPNETKMPSEEFIVNSPIPGYEIPDIAVGQFLLGKIQRILESNPEKVALVSIANNSPNCYS